MVGCTTQQDSRMAFSVLLLLALQLASLFCGSRSIILCDEGCLNSPGASELDICMKDIDPDRTTILLMGLFPCNVPDFRARGLTVAGQMAIRAVRRNTSILQDYKLELSFSNTMVSRNQSSLTLVSSKLTSYSACRLCARHNILVT